MNNDTFKVGEIAILANPHFHHELRNCEVEIIAALDWRFSKQRGMDIWCYRIHAPDGFTYRTTPDQLRKRRPPQDWVKLCNLVDLPLPRKVEA